MITKRARPDIQTSRLKSETIFAIVVLCVLISAALLVILGVGPGREETITYSPSHSHGASSTRLSSSAPADALAAKRLTRAEARQILSLAGYQEVRGLRSDGTYFRATAVRFGNSWEVEIDPGTRLISRAPLSAR
jgi:hypothetical protein